LSAVEDFPQLQTPTDSPPLEQPPAPEQLEQLPALEQAAPPEQPRPPSHRGQRSRRALTSKRGILAALAAAVLVVSLAAVVSSRAGASTTPKRLIALEWAEQQAGHWYCWGGNGPCFDCSGLVVAAYHHAGISLPRTTYGMLSSPLLRRIPASQRRRGDLAFYGTGHVELVTIHGTFGALHTGTRIGWHHPNPWWFPTMYFRVV
jgi:cell wall-associated NlpC family hydrolase